MDVMWVFIGFVFVGFFLIEKECCVFSWQLFFSGFFLFFDWVGFVLSQEEVTLQEKVTCNIRKWTLSSVSCL